MKKIIVASLLALGNGADIRRSNLRNEMVSLATAATGGAATGGAATGGAATDSAATAGATAAIESSFTGGATDGAGTGATDGAGTGATADVALPAAKKSEGQWLGNIHDSIASLNSFSRTKATERQQVCQAEFASIKKEQKEEETDEKNDRSKQKANLAAALDARIAGMGPMLNKLMALMKQLKGHIDNVNLIFQAKYAQDEKDMLTASHAFEELMKHATVGNPKDTPIKVPEMPALDLNLLEVGTGVFAERLQEMQQRLQTHLDGAGGQEEEPKCNQAHQAAVDLFHKGARYHEEIKQFFDAERTVLAGFREQLANVLRSKLAKLAKLKAQSSKLKDAMKIKEVDMKKALGDALKAHEEIIHAACSQMDAHAASNGPKRAALMSSSNACAGETGNGAPVKVGQETLDNKVEAMEEEVEETAKESGATGAELKGIEKKDATGGGAAENVEKVEEKVEKVEKKKIEAPEPIKGGSIITV